MKRREVLPFVVPILLAFVAVDARAQADPSTRSFPAYKCKYSLPGPNWRWVETTEKFEVCSAESDDGVVVMLTITPNPRRLALNPVEFEKGLFRPELTKRGGTHVDHKGQRAYQATGTIVAVNRTIAGRALTGHGHCYMLAVIGGADPVENRPDFAKIVESFDVEPDATPPVEEKDISYRMGQIAAYVLILALILWVGKKLLGYG